MHYNITDIELQLRNSLMQGLGDEAGERLYAQYVSAKGVLDEQILKQIGAVQPDLSDHGIDHVEDVICRACALTAHDPTYLSPLEWYILLVGILFHDVGNLYGRNNHQRNVQKVYDYIRRGPTGDQNEKLAVLRIVEAHCGKTASGSTDTISAVGMDVNFKNERIRLKEIAAILRFADELAEGKQRTSEFWLKQKKYEASSTKYHEYAQATDITIDQSNKRIAVGYNINLEFGGDDSRTLLNMTDVAQLLEFAGQRLVKLDEERRYARYYCSALGPFSETQAVFMFWLNGRPATYNVPLNLTDLVIPEETASPADLGVTGILASLVAEWDGILLAGGS